MGMRTPLKEVCLGSHMHHGSCGGRPTNRFEDRLWFPDRPHAGFPRKVASKSSFFVSELHFCRRQTSYEVKLKILKTF